MQPTPTVAPPLPPPAPGAEHHPALDLANSIVTLPAGRVMDTLTSPAAATTWLVGHGLAVAGAPLQNSCLTRLTALRRDIRALFEAVVAGVAPAPDTLDALNGAMQLTPTAELLRWDPREGLRRTTAHPLTQVVEHAMAQLAADAAAIVTGADVERLALCGAPSCNRLLLRTHARRQWCSTRCGDRVRASRAYARRTA